MKCSIKEIEKSFDDIVELLTTGKEECIIVTKDDIPVVKMISLTKKSKRIGIAKEEMSGFDLSLEEFDSISII